MRALPCFLLLAALAASAGASAQNTHLYQWKDAQGVTHYSDSPPEGRSANDRHIANTSEPAPATSAAKPVENARCTAARRNLGVLAKDAEVQIDSDGDGKPDTVLDEAGRASQKAIAEAEAKAYCTPLAAAK